MKSLCSSVTARLHRVDRNAAIWQAVRRIERTRDGCDGSDTETMMRLNAALTVAEKELRETADLLTLA